MTGHASAISQAFENAASICKQNSAAIEQMSASAQTLAGMARALKTYGRHSS